MLQALCLVFCSGCVFLIEVCMYGWHLAPISVRCVCYSYTRKLLSRKKFMNPTFHLHILASGSKGNCTLLETPDGLIMIDCGISRKEILRRSKELNVNLSALVAIFITHEHTDHVAGLSVVQGESLARTSRLPLLTRQVLSILMPHQTLR